MGMSADCMASINSSMYTQNTLLAEHFSSVPVDAGACSAITTVGQKPDNKLDNSDSLRSLGGARNINTCIKGAAPNNY